MPAASLLHVRSLRVRPVIVPLTRALISSGGSFSAAPFILVDLETDEGVTGRSYVFCYTDTALAPTAQLVANLGPVLQGKVISPFEFEKELQKRFKLLGPQGLTGIAMAAIDMAAWDALAKSADLPLFRLLGGAVRPIPAYNSNGLGIIGAERAAAEAGELLEGGFRAVKVRLGYPEAKADVETLKAVRKAVGDDIHIMTDYNQSLTVPEAVRRIRMMKPEQPVWVEEPTRADDYTGHAAIRGSVKLPIQLGENWWGPHEMQKAINARAMDFAMVDAMKIGGVSGWMRAAAAAELASLPLSSHLFPEISAHLLAVTPTAHWLEYVDWANPILKEPLRIENGNAVAPDRPGVGLEWNEEAVLRFGLS